VRSFLAWFAIRQRRVEAAGGCEEERPWGPAEGCRRARGFRGGVSEGKHSAGWHHVSYHKTPFLGRQ